MLAKMGRIALIAEEMGRHDDARKVAARLAEASQVQLAPHTVWGRVRAGLILRLPRCARLFRANVPTTGGGGGGGGSAVGVVPVACTVVYCCGVVLTTAQNINRCPHL